MPKVSAGILMYRRRGNDMEVFLVHPGGPFWSGKDDGAWSIPKGLINPDEDALSAAQREFTEETGFTASGPFVRLAPITQPGGKKVHAWALESDCDPSAIRSNTFSMEWPPRSGNWKEFPEVNRAEWFSLKEAEKKINRGQLPLLDELRYMVSKKRSSDS
jgi:predicted NUDIX family NTP pyrophosphohydrolase